MLQLALTGYLFKIINVEIFCLIVFLGWRVSRLKPCVTLGLWILFFCRRSELSGGASGRHPFILTSSARLWNRERRHQLWNTELRGRGSLCECLWFLHKRHGKWCQPRHMFYLQKWSKREFVCVEPDRISCLTVSLKILVPFHFDRHDLGVMVTSDLNPNPVSLYFNITELFFHIII